jgi:streptomycin 6-kinase
MVRALAHVEGAVLLERLLPGTPLVDEDIDDDEATAILANVIGRLSPEPPPSSTPTIESWGRSFQRYTAAGAPGIPSSLVEAAHETYRQLCASQSDIRLLHGDLHHHNVLFDSKRGWLAIDPKGVAGELAYEVGAALRNPFARLDLFATPSAIGRRVEAFARILRLDPARILAWAFAQAVLAALWEFEDDGVAHAGVGWIAFANAARRMLDGRAA